MKQLENTVQMDDFCAKYMDRQSTLYMITTDDQLNSASENTKTQEKLDHKVSTQVSARFDYHINQMQQKPKNVTHN